MTIGMARARRDLYIRPLHLSLMLPCLLLVAVAACGSDGMDESLLPDAVRVDGIELQAEVETSGFFRVQVHSTVVVTNVSDRMIEFGYGYCSIRSRAYRTPQRTDEPVWRLADQQYSCPEAILTSFVLPGSSLTVADTARAWLLPHRHYWTVSFEFYKPVNRTVELRG